MNTNATSLQALSCLHCGLPARDGTSFCCAGCASVYALLTERGLGHFYQLRGEHSFRPPSPAPAVPVSAENESAALAARTKAKFLLEGVHCLGCLWLLEKLPEIDSRVRSARLDLAHDILEVEIAPSLIRWSEVIELISSLGYRPRALAETESAENARRAEQRRQLTRMGIAAFGTGNIMLLAVSIYAGADTFWARNFAWISALLAAPVLTYSAWPLYEAAFRPLRRGRLSIDLAIVIALLSGIAMSTASLARGSGARVYFDSLSMLVFLLLSSRYLLQRMREALWKSAACLQFQAHERFARVHPAKDQVGAEDIAPGDILLLEPGQVLPVDATLADADEAWFDLSLLTGESLPIKIQGAEFVEAGSRLTGRPARLRAHARAAESRLAEILAQIKNYELHRSPAVDFADRMGRRFVIAVLFLCGTLWLVNPADQGLERALALAIVTCPCVLAFAIPLALTRSLQRAAAAGIVFRESAKLEALATADRLYLDKTGTLTTGKFEVMEWRVLRGDLAQSQAAAAELERHSSHPVARAIVRESRNLVSVRQATQVEEIPGTGIYGEIAGHDWAIERSPLPARPGENRVRVSRDGEPRAEILLGDALRPEASPILEKLRRLGLEPHLLSGDSPASTGALASLLGVRHWAGGLRPEDKARVLREHPGIMVGDGANDAVAFRAAAVGVAMQGSVEMSLRHADVLLTKPGLASLLEAIELARATMRLVRQCFSITLTYNLLAGALAIGGLMQPLFAALLMPLSALTVFGYITWRTPRRRGEEIA